VVALVGEVLTAPVSFTLQNRQANRVGSFMFFFFPYATDAPLYHLPIATIGLIVANILVFIGMVTGHIPDVENWILWYGDGLHPAQWLTSTFTHAGIEHLVGNMMFLWVFGLIVEGKLGWWKFLCCYLGIGVVHSMLEQILMLGYTGEVPGSLGASAAIFGIMAMAAVWAPLNEITFFWIFFVRTGTFEVGVYVMAAFYTGLEIIMVLVYGGTAGSSLLHITGALVGLPLAIVLLKWNLVDCDSNDLFHVWSGDYGNFKQEPDRAQENAKLADLKRRRDCDQLDQAKAQLHRYLQEGNYAAAATLVTKMKEVGGGLTLDRNELILVIKGLHAAGRWSDSAPLMAELIDRFPENADLARVKLAQICVVELNRPGKALDLLKCVDAARLPAPQLALAKKVAAKARQMQTEGDYELDTNTW
jgi:membrane associated rhomboid family serine protease